MHTPFALPTSVTDFRYGQPQETFYSRTEAYRPRFKDVEHLVNAGRLMHTFGDWEATGAKKEMDQPFEGGFLAFDLNMRLIGRLGMRMALGNLRPMAIQAALVTRVFPEDVKKGWPGYIGMGMYRDFLHAAAHLDGEKMGLPRRVFSDDNTSYLYNLDFPDAGRVELEIKNSGDKFRFPGEEKWKKKLYSETHFFNGDSYDIHLAAHTAARYNMASLFHATRRSHAAIHVDPLSLARWVWAFGPQGRSGLQLLKRYHFKTRRDVLSFKQGHILAANSPAAYRALGRDGGIRLYDGTEYDPERDHGAMPDAAGTAALYVLLRQIDPDGMRFVESMANEHLQKNFLQGNEEFNDRPLVGFVHYDEGMISRGIGFLIETGDQHGQERKNEVLIFNASAHDPEQVGRMTDSELKAGLVQKHEPIAVAYRTNRTCQFADFERAYRAGAGSNLTPDDYHRRRMWLMNHRHTMWRIMTIADELKNPPRPPTIVTTRPPEDDSFVHYGDLKRIEAVRDEPKDIYKRFQIKWDTARNFDTLLKKLMETHAVEYSADPKALEDYNERYERCVKTLEKLQGNWGQSLVLPPNAPTTNEEAVKHLWGLRVRLHDHLFNYLPERFVQDEHGQNLSIEDAMRVPYHIRKDLWQPEDQAAGAYWKCVFERHENLSTFRLLDMALDEADPFYRQHPSPSVRAWWKSFYEEHFSSCREWHEARVALKVQGPPNLDPSQHPAMTVAQSAYEGQRIRNTAATGKGSDYDRFVAHTPEGVKILAAWEEDSRKKLKRHRLTPEKQLIVGHDPNSRLPLLNDFFAVPRRDVIRLVVPDTMLDAQAWHPQWKHHLVCARPSERQTQRALEQLTHTGKPVVLVGAMTGMERLAAKAFCFPLPKTADGLQARQAAESAYASAGAKLGAHPVVLKCEQFPPIHGKRDSDESVQRVVLSSLDWASLVDARAGSLPKPLKPVTGLVLRDIGQNFTPGKIRLRRMHQSVETGDEFEGVLAAAERKTIEDIVWFRDKDAQNFGHPTAADMYSKWKKVFAELSIRDPGRQKLWFLRLEKAVSRKSYTYAKTDEFPVAVYTPMPQRPSSAVARRSRNPSQKRAA